MTLLTSLGLWAAWMGLPSVPIEPVSTEHARAAVCACARRDSSTGRGSQGTGTETPSQRRGRDGTGGGTRRLRRGRCASAPRDPCLEWTTHRRTSPWPARLAIGQGPPRQARRCSMRTRDGGSRGGATPPGLSRRRWLQGVTATAGLLTLSQCGRVRTVPPPTDGLPEPGASGIEHVVWVMMENRSFEHFLGWLPGANGQQAGGTYPDRTGGMQPTYRLAPDFQGCGHPDPDHSYQGGGSPTTAAQSTGGFRPARTTPMRSAMTRMRTWLSWDRPPAPGRSAITTAPLSWPTPFRTASISMPHRRTACATRRP